MNGGYGPTGQKPAHSMALARAEWKRWQTSSANEQNELRGQRDETQDVIAVKEKNTVGTTAGSSIDTAENKWEFNDRN